MATVLSEKKKFKCSSTFLIVVNSDHQPPALQFRLMFIHITFKETFCSLLCDGLLSARPNAVERQSSDSR